ncbi:hypothetical protein GWI33_007083, partial [Rhynchophorus ferrugineus]
EVGGVIGRCELECGPRRGRGGERRLGHRCDAVNKRSGTRLRAAGGSVGTNSEKC